MADEKEKISSKIIKGILTSLLGALSGAVIMFVSPLLNSAIKPPKPVPNFSYVLEGAVATFNNRSTGGAQGWWDFGDGSALEAFSPNQASIVHKFPGPGNYVVKLSLHNLIGEEVERTAPVKIDAQMPPPTIDDFTVTPITSGGARPTAPATFRITSKLKNVDLIIWSIDDQPLELVNDAIPSSLERDVTFDSYGSKKIRLMAAGGKNKVEKEFVVFVDVPADDPMILIKQTSYASTTKTMPISVSFPAQFNGPTYPFEFSRRLAKSSILEVNVDWPGPQLVRNASVTIGPDKESFTVSGELVRQSGNAPTNWYSKAELKIANTTAPGAKRSDPVTANLQLPGRTAVTLPPAPSGMAGGLEWELRQGMDVIYKDVKIPVTQVVQFKDKTYRVTVSNVGSQVQIDATETTSLPLLNTSQRKN